MTLKPSGPAWCRQFPCTIAVDDLAEPFRSAALSFLAALKSAGASVIIATTWRPAERAYLMHWAWAIARGLPANMCRPGDKPGVPVMPSTVPPLAGVDIDWGHAGARSAAEQMITGYGMEACAALTSRHTQRLAIDMHVAWQGTIAVTDTHGVVHKCKKQEDLFPVGATFWVFKLVTDPPHWSVDGH